MRMERRSDEELARMSEIAEQLPSDLGGLVGKLDDPDHMVRRAAATRLGSMEDPAAVPSLLIALEDDHYEVRASAALALGILRDPRAVPPLLAHAANDPVPGVRMMSTCAAGLGSDEVTNGLEHVLDDPDEHVRLAACNHFACRDDRRAVPQIRELLTHANHHIRSTAAGMLIRLGIIDVQVFRALEKDESWHVRQSVAEDLVRAKVADPRVVTAIERLMQEPEAAEYEARIAEAEEFIASTQSDDEPDDELSEEEQAELRELEELQPKPLSELLDRARMLL